MKGNRPQETGGAGADGHDRATALLSLALSEPDVDSPEPTIEEIAAVVDGLLGEPRRSEVMAHIAASDDLYQVWLSLAGERAEETTPREPGPVSWSKRFSRWLFTSRTQAFGGAFAGVAVLAAVAFVVAPLMRATLDERISRDYRTYLDLYGQTGITGPLPGVGGFPSRGGVPGLEPEQEARDRAWFRAGLNRGLVRLAPDEPYWREVLSTLPESGPDCGARDLPGCEGRREALGELGRWSALIAAACSQDPARVDPDFWRRQASVLERLDGRLDALETPGGPLFVSAWREEGPFGDDPRTSLCRSVTALIASGAG